MTTAPHARHAIASGLLAIAIVFFGCTLGSPSSSSTGTHTPGLGTPSSGGGGGGGGGGAPTATPTPPPHALAWYQIDSHNVPQIWASLSGASPTQITHVAADGSACADQIAWSPPVFSPDLTHIVAALGSFGCGDGNLYGPLSIIRVSSGTVSAVPSAGTAGDNQISLSTRTAGFVNNNTVWWLSQGNVYEYTLGGSSTLVTGLASGATYPVDAAVRGNTLFYETSTFTSGGIGGSYAYALQRYDLSAHSALGGTINLGGATGCSCSPGDRLNPGFDVSHDGAHVVYQRTTASGSTTSTGIASSQFFYANADGSGASQIAHYVATNAFAFVLLSPNGQLVALSGATPSPSVISASVSSPGNSGDPNLHFYTPDGNSYPVWKWDNSTFWSSTQRAAGYPLSGNLEHFNVGTSAGSVGVSGAYNPWYTIGA